MARIEPNSAIKAIRGRHDGIIYRTVRGQIQALREPRRTKPRTKSEAEGTFSKGAQFFAEVVKPNPALSALYRARALHNARRKKKLLNYRQLTIADYFSDPAISDITTSHYSVTGGGLLTIFITEVGIVARVTVALRDAAGNTLQAGDAVPDGNNWSFMANPLTVDPATIFVTATDIPGNTGERSFPVPVTCLRRPRITTPPTPAAAVPTPAATASQKI
jgi:hypothetical protein